MSKDLFRIRTILTGTLRGMMLICAAGLASACREPGTPAPPPSVPPPPRATLPPSEIQVLESFAENVQSAPDHIAEADALKRLRRWIADHGMTYSIRSEREVRSPPGQLLADVEVPVASASATDQPLTTTMQVFRGREHLLTFRFVPRDNRNLALLGE